MLILLTACTAGTKQPPSMPEQSAAPSSRGSDTINPLEEAAKIAASIPEAFIDESEEDDITPTFDSEQPDTLSGNADAPATPEEKPAATVQADEMDIPAKPFAAAAASDVQLDPILIEQELLRLINRDRLANDAEALGIEESMQFAARIRAEEVLQSLSQTRPNGMPYHTAFDEAGFVYAGKWHGQNISMLYFEPGRLDEVSIAHEMFNTLTASPGNHQNMISQNFLQAGIGAHIAYEPERTYVGSAQLFASY